MNISCNDTIEHTKDLAQQVQALLQHKNFSQAKKLVQPLIEQQPESSTGYLLMAKIHAASGSFEAQIESLDQALHLSAHSSEILADIAQAYLNLCQLKNAYHFANLALDAQPNNAELLQKIANIYNKLGKYEQAIPVLEQAIVKNSNNYQLYYALGSSLTLCGKIAPAISAYQQALTLNPNAGVVYAALSKARTANSQNNNVEQLRTLAKAETDAKIAISIYHGLAKELDDLGLYSEAFKALSKGKNRLRAVCRHQPKNGAKIIRGLTALYQNFGQEINAATEATNASDAAPIFVTGMPRTGTTIVERILTNHQDVATIGESIELSLLLKQQCQQKYAGLIEPEVLAKSWSTINFEQLGRDYIDNIGFLCDSKQRFVDKLPLNILMAGVILRALPKAKIVCLVRDPFDTIIGNYRQNFEQASGTYAHTLDLHALADYVYEFRMLVASLQQQFPARFMAVEYESLVENPELEAKKLFEFCQLSWQPTCLAINKNSAPVGTASAAQVQQPIHTKAIGHSRHYLFCLQDVKAAWQAKENTIEPSAQLPELYYQAQTLFQQQKYHQAEEMMERLIAQEAEHVRYYQLMAQIKEMRGSYQEQINNLHQALVLTPDVGEYLITIAFAHLNLGQFEQAIVHADLAAKDSNNSAEILSLISKLYSKLGIYDQAAQVLEQAVKLNSQDAKLYYRLGGALTLCGKIKAAVAAYQQSIALEPNDPLVYAALSKARKATETDNNIEQLQALVVKHRNPWTAINVYHGLAKELDDLGRYEEAYKTLTRGKKRLRSVCAFNPFSGAENIKALSALYCDRANEINTANSNSAASTGNDSAPIFITGMPRTGTTVIERMLTNHDEVITVGERFQLSALLKQHCQRGFAGLVDAQVLKEVWSTIDFAKLGDDYIKSVDYLSHGSHRFVDKLPLNILLTGVILRALPKAKVICLLRDPLDTIIGNYRQVFEQASGAYAHTLDLDALANFVYEFRQLVKTLKQQFPQRFMVVHYEDVVEQPAAQGQKLFEFCQLTWHERYLAIHKNKAPVGTASAAQVQEPIHKKSLGKSHHYQFCLTQIKQAFASAQEV
ncbi:sulfotransferase [Thalassotalea sp. PLHSN55]|uniref:tetratricopeptide repeat-containing sulfotransferase family protein n=1 Tax=Thalassotalea sp. PLHSN55 TaxID=3435888 RepID=UPI003F824A40